MIFKTLLPILNINSTYTRCIHFTKVLTLDQKWRSAKGLPQNPNSYGILTDSPDYTFLDGRPTPYGIRQKRRLIKQKEIAEKVIQLTKEVDFAVERYEQLQLEKATAEQKLIDSKLKPKGKLLLLRNKQRMKDDIDKTA